MECATGRMAAMPNRSPEPFSASIILSGSSSLKLTTACAEDPRSVTPLTLVCRAVSSSNCLYTDDNASSIGLDSEKQADVNSPVPKPEKARGLNPQEMSSFASEYCTATVIARDSTWPISDDEAGW